MLMVRAGYLGVGVVGCVLFMKINKRKMGVNVTRVAYL